VFRGKPSIGIVGGIGSGKSFVAKLFGELGCLVVNSDDQVRDAYRDPRVIETLRQWWGDEVIGADGSVNKRAIGQRVFADPQQRRRLEGLLHPLVNAAREQQMEAAADDRSVVAFVWDTPLLIEAGLHEKCDAVVFVDAPLETRLRRVRETRSWDAAELARRENLQQGLDRKRGISDYVVGNTADVDYARRQVREVLSRILARTIHPPDPS
jgi:dephospho-CoA kinase